MKKIPKGASIGRMTVLEYQSITGEELPERSLTDPVWVIFDQYGEILGISNEYVHESDKYFTDESSLA
jgi:hypothetical protein